MVVQCPARGGTLISYSDLLTLVNVEAGVIVIRWRCCCGSTHLRATGSVAERHPDRAAAAVLAVRQRLRDTGDRAGGLDGSDDVEPKEATP